MERIIIKTNKINLLKILLENQDKITLIDMRKAIKELNFNEKEEEELLRRFN